MKFAQFMARAFGRGIRIALGVALVLVGLLALLPAGKLVIAWILVAIGGFFIAIGALNVCPLALLFGGSFSGRKALAAAKRDAERTPAPGQRAA